MFMRLARTAIKHVAWFFFRIRDGAAASNLIVRRGPAKGASLTLDVRKHGLYWIGAYDEWILSRIDLARYVRPGDAVWDCGAYIGYYTAVLRNLVGETGKVIAFEGSSRHFARLSSLPARNNWPNVQIRHCAVGPDHSTISFDVNREGGAGPRGLFDTGQLKEPGLEQVTCCGVDELVDEHACPAPRFIKFDLEGGEAFALHNGNRVFRDIRPFMILELHGREPLVAAGRFLEEYDYCAGIVHHLPKFAGMAQHAWDLEFARIAITSSEQLTDAERKESNIPPALFCIPTEHTLKRAQSV